MAELIERHDVTAELDRLLDGCRSGSGHVVLLEGPPGSGRTSLLNALRDRTRQRGLRFLGATGAPQESDLPLGVVTQILGAAGRRPGRADVSPPPASELLELAADAPLVIAVDDVWHADEPSLLFLNDLARRLADARILLVLAGAGGRAARHPGPRAELLRQPHVRRLPLAPLSVAGVAEAAGARLEPATARALSADLATTSGGNPLLLHALLDDHLESGEPAPHGYGQAVLSCLRRYDPAAVRVAQALAVLGRPVTAADLSRLLRLDADLCAQAVTAMTGGGLLGDGAFRHPAGRLAVLDDLPPEVRSGLHREAAQLSYDSGAPAIDAARHLVVADQPGPMWTLPILQEAAEQALLDHEPRFAADCLRLALRSDATDRQRASVRARLAQCEWSLNPAASAEHLTTLTAAAEAGRLDSRDALWLVKALLWHARTAEAVRVLDELRGAAPDHTSAVGEPRRDALATMEQWLAYSYPALARPQAAAATPPRRPGVAVALGADPWLRTAASLAGLLCRGATDELVERADQTLRMLRLRGSAPWAQEAAALALYALIYADRGEAAREWCDRLGTEPRFAGTPTARALTAAARAEIAVRGGELAEALRHGEEALTHLRTRSWGVAVGLPLGSIVLAATRMGEYEVAARHLSHELPEAIFESRYGLPYLHARGQYHLATGQHRSALADFLACGEMLRGWNLDFTGIVPWRSGAAEAWLRLGNTDQARALIFEEIRQPGGPGARSRAASLRVLAQANPPGKKMQLLREALDICESRGDRYEQARVLGDLSQAHNALDQKRRARVVFRQALHVADVCGAKPLHRELLSLSGEGADPAAPEPGAGQGIDVLTDSEQRVASLAVMGYTNRDIARRLFITPSTVEQHLTRIYRKLNVKHRRELPADLWVRVSRSAPPPRPVAL